jgi:hypothetical protein
MSIKQVKVFVVDGEDKPLLPTTPRRARKLLDAKKAKVIQVMPFTIRLNRIVDSPVGSFTVGIDDGAKKSGVAVVNEHTQEVVFSGEIGLRQDVSRKISQRASYRRTRRTRKLRYRARREPKFCGETNTDVSIAVLRMICRHTTSGKEKTVGLIR